MRRRLESTALLRIVCGMCGRAEQTALGQSTTPQIATVLSRFYILSVGGKRTIWLPTRASECTRCRFRGILCVDYSGLLQLCTSESSSVRFRSKAVPCSLLVEERLSQFPASHSSSPNPNEILCSQAHAVVVGPKHSVQSTHSYTLPS